MGYQVPSLISLIQHSQPEEAQNQKLNIDNIRTSIFTKTGEMQTLTIHDYEGYSTYDYIQHGTPIAIMGRIEEFEVIKGTGEASPVRGRDWAGFKFAAK